MKKKKNKSKKPYLPSIKYIRGISMLGVVAIHIGSQYLTNPTPNIHLVAFFEIVSRFSVPIFFFISAFGLFYNLNPYEPFDYKEFLRRRFKAVLYPYLAWSVLYILHDTIFLDGAIPNPFGLIYILFFGLAKYQLYFIVILIWFYLLMPLWIKIIRTLTPTRLAIIFFAQIAFNYFSSYSVWLFQFSQSLPPDSFLKPFLVWRLNYLVFHYVFIFLLGGLLSLNSKKFFSWLGKNKKQVTIFFFGTLGMLLAYYYFLIYFRHYSPLSAVNTAHQLSIPGFLYTIGATIFLFMIFQCYRFNEKIISTLDLLGKNSYFVYLFHPIPITYLFMLFTHFGKVMTAANVMILFLLTVIISVGVRELARKFTDKEKNSRS